MNSAVRTSLSSGTAPTLLTSRQVVLCFVLPSTAGPVRAFFEPAAGHDRARWADSGAVAVVAPGSEWEQQLQRHGVNPALPVPVHDVPVAG